MTTSGIVNDKDPFNLNRFETAQEPTYDRALQELQSGQKRTHWMWFVFPQIDGLGKSSKAIFYSIKSEDEARAYLGHPILGARLMECAETLLATDGRTAAQIFGFPDDVKLRSSMTLFAYVYSERSLFHHVLDKYFNSRKDDATLELLGDSVEN